MGVSVRSIAGYSLLLTFLGFVLGITGLAYLYANELESDLSKERTWPIWLTMCAAFLISVITTVAVGKEAVDPIMPIGHAFLFCMIFVVLYNSTPSVLFCRYIEEKDNCKYVYVNFSGLAVLFAAQLGHMWGTSRDTT